MLKIQIKTFFWLSLYYHNNNKLSSYLICPSTCPSICPSTCPSTLFPGCPEVADVSDAFTGKSLLMTAIEGEKTKFAARLLSSGVDLSATDKSGATALHYAVKKEYPNLIKKMLSIAGGGGGALWSETNKNRDVSTGPLARPFARSLAPLTRSLAPDCSLRSRPPLRSLVRSLAHFAHSLARGKDND